MLKRKAGRNPSTLKPGTIFETRIIKRAFITKVNRPRVNIFIGRVRISITGLRKAFIIPNISATTKAVVRVSTLTPGRI